MLTSAHPTGGFCRIEDEVSYTQKSRPATHDTMYCSVCLKDHYTEAYMRHSRFDGSISTAFVKQAFARSVSP